VAALLAVAIITAAGCSGALPALGGSSRSTRTAGDQFFHSLSARFTNVFRTPKFAQARGKLARGALVPSRVWDDTSVWTSQEGDASRTLALHGRLVGHRYVLDAQPVAPAPQHPGESRHVVRLRHLEESDYEWTTHVEHAIGSLRAADGSAAIRALFAAFEQYDERALRRGYRTAFPRGTAALARLVSLDSVRTMHDADGATQVHLTATLRPDRLAEEFPAFAGYVRKYAEPTRYRVAIGDGQGATWLEATAEDGTLRLRARVLGGELVPLAGALRTMPDTLALTVDFETHVMLFDVGIRALEGRLVLVREPHERGVAMRFTREPEWQLPPVVGRLVRSPLQRSFQGDGALLTVTLRDGPPEGQTLIVRESRVAVREGSVLRWLGAVSWRAMGDFVGDAEREENRFNAELFAAFREDVRALPLTATTD
jgi:hypothetical protein